jgi:hypothetical protein
MARCCGLHGCVMPRPPRGSALVALGLALSWMVSTTPVSAGPPIDLPVLPIDYAGAPPVDGRGFWVGQLKGGEWRVTGGRLGRDDRLTLDVEILPPAISVPLQPGPAILFGRLGLYGGSGGDVGAGSDVDRTVARVMPPCADPAACVFRTPITLPTHRLPRLAVQHPSATSWAAAGIGLTSSARTGRGAGSRSCRSVLGRSASRRDPNRRVDSDDARSTT